MAANRARSQVETEIRKTLGLVPTFFDRIPDEVLEHEWKLFRHYELGETLIPNKYKELMGIAIHSQTKCRYCLLFHTEAAKMFGATDEEIEEAVHYAKHTAGWSAYMNGTQQDFDRFEKDVEKIGEHMAAAVSS